MICGEGAATLRYDLHIHISPGMMTAGAIHEVAFSAGSRGPDLRKENLSSSSS